MSPIVRAVAATHFLQAVGTISFIAVPVLAPAIGRESGIDPVHVGAYVGLMWAAAILSSTASGRLIARFGAFGVSRMTAFVCGVGIVAALSGTVPGLIAASILIGVACGPETPASSAILARIVPRPRQPFLFSVKQTGVQAGGMVAGFALPALEAAFEWRGALIAVAALAFVAAFALRPLDRFLDGPRAEPSSGGIREGLRLAVSIRAIRIVSLAAFAFSATQICLNGYLVTFGVVELGFDLATAGALLATAQLGGFIGRPLWGYIASRYLAARPLLAFLGAGMAGSALTLGIFASVLSFWSLAAVAFAFGFTVAGWNGVYIAEVARLAPPDKVGQVSGGAFALSFGGLVVGPLVFGWVAAQGTYGAAYMVVGALCLIGTALLARKN